MNRFVLIALVAFGVCRFTASYGQKQEKADKVVEDQRNESYKSLKNRSSRNSADRLLKEADRLKEKNPSEALNNVQEALAMSIAQSDVFNEGRCYLLIGEINEGIQEWNLAAENYGRAYQQLATSYSTTEEYKRTLRGLGNTSMKLGQYDASLKYFGEILSMRLGALEQSERKLDVSEVYYQMGNYSEALKAVESIQFSPKVSYPSFEARLQNQKAKIYAQLNDLDKTKTFYDNSLNTLRGAKKVDKEQEEALQQNKEEIAGVLHSQNRFDEEIDLRTQSIQYNLESNNLNEVTKDKVAIGKSLEAKGESGAALREVEEAASMADTLDDPKQQANAYLVLADLYEKNGRKDQALATYKKYTAAVAKKETLNETQREEKSSIIKKQKDIEELTKYVSIGQREETIQQATVTRQRLIIYGLLFIIAITAVTSYFIYKNAQASKTANQLLALKSLRSQMNPHFIFNALNSVNHFIAQQDERTANRFLSEFSQLMRLVLENSQEDFISLQREQEILSLYLKLEHYRFRDKFDYEIGVDETIQADAIEVPPMLIQPYIENAVWHGLRYKETKGKLSLNFYRENGDLLVEITDDGIGRKRSAELKTVNQKKHNSTGLKNIQERLGIINKVYHANYRVSVDDLADGAGTRVRIYLPVHNRMNGL